MPPSGYLSSSGIESCMIYLSGNYPAICQLITLPEPSAEGRTQRAVKIGKGSGHQGVLLIGGLHARELCNPDALAGLALRLCTAYTSNSGITLGGKTFDASTIKLLVEALDLYIFPLVNPDGRSYVQSPSGDAWWRKNRRPTPGTACVGADVNRNFDFLWSSGIGTSANPCDYQIFKGTGPFSESESRNVKWLLDTYPIKGLMDLHSYSELVLYPWDDDQAQTTDPEMNFHNPIYDGLRGTVGDSAYKEYMPPADLSWYADTGAGIRDAIQAVRGRTYTLEPSVGLYPSTGTSDGYAYSRYFATSATRKVRAFAVETGTEFQPAFPEAANVMNEGMAAALQFSVSSLCVAEEISAGVKLADRLDRIRHFRDDVLLASPVGRRYVDMLSRHTLEILMQTGRDQDLRKKAQDLLDQVSTVVLGEKKTFSPRLIGELTQAIGRLGENASPALKKSLAAVSADLPHFQGHTVLEGLAAAGGDKPPAGRSRS